MIPLRDNVPNVHPPVALFAILGLNVLALIFEYSLSDHSLNQIFYHYGLIPARLLSPEWALSVGFQKSSFFPLISYTFLHSDWWHLILNMWMLWIFGDNIEDVTGPLGFTVFYLACGAAAAGLHMFFEPNSTIPVVGASGAVAGIMGAYLVLYPHGKVLTLIPIIIIPLIIRVPSIAFLGIWFLVQLYSGFATIDGEQVASVAWWAHVGGFASGAVLIYLFKRKGRCYYCYNPETKDYDPFKRND